jgi:colicin import membrane protein
MMSKLGSGVVAGLLCAGVLGGCLFGKVVELDPEAENVKVVRESTKPLHCKSVANISGTSRSDDEKAARAGAENDFRNQAAKAKANFALIEVERDQRVGTSSTREVFLGGEALQCTTLEMEEAEEAARLKAEEEKVLREQKEKEDAERKAEEDKAKAEQEKAAKAEADKTAKAAKAKK